MHVTGVQRRGFSPAALEFDFTVRRGRTEDAVHVKREDTLRWNAERFLIECEKRRSLKGKLR